MQLKTITSNAKYEMHKKEISKLHKENLFIYRLFKIQCESFMLWGSIDLG